MKHFSYIILILTFFSCVSKAQISNSDKKIEKTDILEVNLTDYFVFNEGDAWIYKCQYIPKHIITNGVSNNHKDLVTVYDTSYVKTIEIDGLTHFYFWEYDPSFYFFNSFLSGLFTIKEDSLYFLSVKKEGDLLEVGKEQLNLLFPKKIKKGVEYNTFDQFDNIIKYRLFDKGSITIEGVKYENTITLTKTIYYDNSENTDSLWMAPKIGLIKLKKSTGRAEVLTY